MRRRGKSVLDYGCGSGILAMVAPRSWRAADVAGVDIDPQAIESARAAMPSATSCDIDFYLPDEFGASADAAAAASTSWWPTSCRAR